MISTGSTEEISKELSLGQKAGIDWELGSGIGERNRM